MGAWVPYFAVAFVIIVNFLVYSLNENSLPWRRFAAGRRGWLFISNRYCIRRLWDVRKYDWLPRSRMPDLLLHFTLVVQFLLLALRLLALVYFATYFVVEAEIDNGLGPYWLKYFTNWSFCLFALSMVLGAACVASDMLKQRQQQRQRQYAAVGTGTSKQPGSASSTAAGVAQALVESPPCSQCGSKTGGGLAAVCTSCATGQVQGWTLLGKTHLATVAMAFPAEIFLTLFYWIFLFDGDASEGLATNIMVHGTNNIFALADVLLSRIPFVSYHFQLLLLYGSMYLVFMWIYYGATGTWVYDSLDWSKSRSAAMYLLLPLFLAACFFFYWGLARLRERFSTCQRTAKARAEAIQPAEPEPTDLQLALV